MESMTAGLERLNALLNWWGISGKDGSSGMVPDLGRFAATMSAMQKAYFDAFERHVEIVLATNDRIARTARGLATMRNPGAFVDAQSELTAALTDAGAAFAKTWGELSAAVEQVAARGTPAVARSAAEPPIVAVAPSVQKAA